MKLILRTSEIFLKTPEDLRHYLEHIEDESERIEVVERWRRRQNARLAVCSGLLNHGDALFYIDHGFLPSSSPS